MKSAGQSNAFSRNYSLNIHGRLMDFRTPKIMGILNVTPDSFYGGSRYQAEDEIRRQVERMLAEGADIIDVGGQSTRPGAEIIPLADERARIVGAVNAIVKAFPGTIISVDTFRSAVAEAAVSEGAQIVNDVSGGGLDEHMFETVSRLRVPYVLMHMRGTPSTMASLNSYDNLHFEVIRWLQEKLRQLLQYGISDVIIDPGFGFSKSPSQNFHLLKGLPLFQSLERPVMVGLSRKSMIWRTLGTTAENALNGTTVLNTLALLNGASILRVHDVREAAEAIRLCESYENAG